MNRRADKLYFYKIKYYSAVKKNEPELHVSVWINLRNTVLSWRGQQVAEDICSVPCM